MSPGAHQKRPGSITVMNDDNVSERVVALAQQALDLLRFIKGAPPSPFKTFLPAKRRRVLRRDAARLREGKAEPRYKNLHSAEELAALYERTALRDEIFEQGVRQIQWIARDFGRIRKEHPAELQTAMEAFVREAHQSAEQHGPRSEAARRYETLLYLAGLGQQLGQQRHSHRRRQRAPVPRRIDLAPDASIEKLYAQTAAELLTSPPSSDDAVIAIPPHGQDSGRERIFLRIGLGQASWIGSFERGHTRGSTVYMLPDDKHLFVSAEGAGYVIDAKSRTLVETTGTQVIGATGDEPRTLFVVDHNGMSLEAFGRTGRLWKTNTIGSGGFRRMTLMDDALVGEARHPAGTGWVRFSVKVATGEVEIDATEDRTE